MKLKGKTILVISNESWGPVWYSKHNYANELSKNNKIYFIDPSPKFTLTSIFTSSVKIYPIKENLFLVKYKNIIPGYLRSKLLFHLNEIINSRRIYKAIVKKSTSKVILWSFDPYRFVFPKLLHVDFTIYHYTDDYHNFGLNMILKKADVVLTISSMFLKEIIKNKKPFYITNHSISREEFKVDKNFIEHKINDKDYILYVGTIDERVDFSVLEDLICAFPNEKFVFIGRVTSVLNTCFDNIFIKAKYSNVKSLGVINFKDLRNYIAKSKICIAPMSETVRGNRINHQKLLQYLAQGKAVFCSSFEDYKMNNILYQYVSVEETHKLFNKALIEANDPKLIKKRIEFAENYTFDKQINRIEKFINSIVNDQ